jgi:hypothetical protein
MLSRLAPFPDLARAGIYLADVNGQDDSVHASFRHRRLMGSGGQRHSLCVREWSRSTVADRELIVVAEDEERLDSLGEVDAP